LNNPIKACARDVSPVLRAELCFRDRAAGASTRLPVAEDIGQLAERADQQPAGAYMTHIVSDTPTETHVFLSLLHQTPFYVGTSKNITRKVEGGRMQRMRAPPPQLK
jgi:hypothetical protein